MSNKKNKAKVRAARAEQTIAKQRTELILLRSQLDNARKSHAEILKRLDATESVLRAEEKYLKPWRVTVDGLMRGGMRFDNYMLRVTFDPRLCVAAFQYMPQSDRNSMFRDYSIEIEYLCEQIAREARQVLQDVMQKDGVLR